jgi:alpha-D-ribose 1-methylphosphonate 5-triphosphate synthase subunit PhnH
MDLETALWLQPGLSEVAKSWLLFHTGCCITRCPEEADFAVIIDSETMPRLDEFKWGTAEYPEASTSLLIQLPSLQAGYSVTLQGPGILGAIALQTALSQDFWQQWHAMANHYPLGLDAWCFDEQQVLGLPRTAQVVHPVKA